MRSWIAPALITVSALVCYANSFDGDFVFDDRQYVAGNPAIQTLWPPYDWLVFSPTRPLVYFTFAVNYALGGEEVFGYHVVNLLIHIITALALYGLIRRALERPMVPEVLRRRAAPLAAVTALIWTVHPLCTQAVTYIYQRLESLAAMFAVLSCYALMRACENQAQPRRGWTIASIGFCVAAMLSKESVAGLPVLLLLFDRLFLAGSWKGILARRRYHLATFCTWGLALGLMAATGYAAYARSGIAEVPGTTRWIYLRSQSGVILEYLRLVVWPSRQCLDYGWPPAMRAGEYVLQTAAVLVLLSATLWGVYRGRLWSFPAAACFVLLAPTSSIIPIADLYFEHRMYLPAACILTLLVCGGALGLQQLVPQAVSERAGARLAAVAVCVIVAALGTATIVRNRVYADELILWQEIVDKAPHNPRGPYLLGSYYLHEGRRDLADRYLNRCIEANPLFVPAQMQYLELLYQEKRLEEAERTLLMLEEALAYDATVRIYAAEIFAGFGNLRMQQNRADEAMRHFMRTLEVDPTNSDALNNMAMLLAGAGRANDAIALFRQALAAYPNDAATHNNLGVVYRNAGKLDEAAAEFRAAIELSPKSAEARANLGSVLELQGRGDEALAELRRAVEIDDGYIGAHINLGTALARRGQFTDARRHLQRAVELDPTNATARSNLAQVEQDLAAAQSQSSVPATP